MGSTRRKTTDQATKGIWRPRLCQYVGLALLPVAAYLLFRLVFDHAFVIEQDMPICLFLSGKSFLREFMGRPGGWVYWAGRFLAQFAHRPWLGPLAVAGSVGVFGLTLNFLLTRRGKGTPQFVGTFLPCMLLLTLHTLSLRVMADALGLSIICTAFRAAPFLTLSPTTQRLIPRG